LIKISIAELAEKSQDIKTILIFQPCSVVQVFIKLCDESNIMILDAAKMCTIKHEIIAQ